MKKQFSLLSLSLSLSLSALGREGLLERRLLLAALFKLVAAIEFVVWFDQRLKVRRERERKRKKEKRPRSKQPTKGEGDIEKKKREKHFGSSSLFLLSSSLRTCDTRGSRRTCPSPREPFLRTFSGCFLFF